MKILLNIISGMLGAGKTHYINEMIKKLTKEKIVIIQLESGKEAINKNFKNIKIIKLDVEQFTENEIKKICMLYKPDRLIVECNIMKRYDDQIKVLYKKEFVNIFKYEKKITLIDTLTFDMYFKNMATLIYPCIENADIIKLNNETAIKKNKKREIIKALRRINPNFFLLEESRKNRIFNGNKIFNTLFTLIISCILIILIYDFLRFKDLININVEWIKIACIKFTGIIIETIPFIILGATVSGIIQVFISDEKLINIFPKNTFLSCIFSSMLGIFLPICECGSIPIARGLLRRGIPMSSVITFLLASPIVNPIAILSTVIVFSDNKSIIVYRIFLGLIVSILSGLVVGFLCKNKKVITDEYYCNCSNCSNMKNTNNTIFKKLKLTSNYIINELIEIGKFIVIGAFLSSLLQSIISIEAFDLKNLSLYAELGIIVLFSLLFSICSTSDAFIAKGFIDTISTRSIIGFLILGPIINIKNIILLKGSFSTSLIFKLILTVITICLTLLITMTI